MGVAVFGDVIVHGNFAEVLPEKPKDFNYETDAKWLEPYPEEWKERVRIGSVICTCKTVEVHYAPYYGFDFYHQDSCNLMRQVKARPQLMNLPAYDHLPAIVFFEGAVVPASMRQGIYVDYHKHGGKVAVKVNKPTDNLALF